MRNSIFILIVTLTISLAKASDSTGINACYITPQSYISWVKMEMSLRPSLILNTIEAARLCNGTFSELMNNRDNVSWSIEYAKQDSTNYEKTEYVITYLRVLNRRIESGYGATHPAGIHTFHSDQIFVLPQRNINSIAGLVAGVDSRNGQTPNIKGARQEGTAYYIDGVRVYE